MIICSSGVALKRQQGWQQLQQAGTLPCCPCDSDTWALPPLCAPPALPPTPQPGQGWALPSEHDPCCKSLQPALGKANLCVQLRGTGCPAHSSSSQPDGQCEKPSSSCQNASAKAICSCSDLPSKRFRGFTLLPLTQRSNTHRTVPSS